MIFGCFGGWGGRPSETCRTETKYEQMFFLHITLSEKGQNNFLMGLKNLVKLGVGIFFFFKIPISKTVFSFSFKTSGFSLNGCSLSKKMTIF